MPLNELNREEVGMVVEALGLKIGQVGDWVVDSYNDNNEVYTAELKASKDKWIALQNKVRNAA